LIIRCLGFVAPGHCQPERGRYRLVVRRRDARCALCTRRGYDWCRFPAISAAIAGLAAAPLVIDESNICICA
jgi:hypothetical protein